MTAINSSKAQGFTPPSKPDTSHKASQPRSQGKTLYSQNKENVPPSNTKNIPAANAVFSPVKKKTRVVEQENSSILQNVVNSIPKIPKYAPIDIKSILASKTISHPMVPPANYPQVPTARSPRAPFPNVYHSQLPPVYPSQHTFYTQKPQIQQTQNSSQIQQAQNSAQNFNSYPSRPLNIQLSPSPISPLTHSSFATPSYSTPPYTTTTWSIDPYTPTALSTSPSLPSKSNANSDPFNVSGFPLPSQRSRKKAPSRPLSTSLKTSGFEMTNFKIDEQKRTSGQQKRRRTLSDPGKTSFNEPAKKTRRVILSFQSNLTSSEQTETEPITEQTVRQHASERLRFQFQEFFVEYGYALTKDDAPLNIQINTRGATLQGGTGTNGRHASHRFLHPGRTDNVKKEITNYILQKGVEGVEHLLEGRLKPEVITGLKEHHNDAQYVETALQDFCTNGQAESLWAGTELELEFNSTTELPSELNQIVDAGLARALEDKLNKWIHPKVMRGEMTPTVAIHLVEILIKEHFTLKVIPQIDKKIDLLVTYLKDLKEFFKSNNFNFEVRSLISSFNQHDCGVPKTKLNQNIGFLKSCLDHLKLTGKLSIKEEDKKDLWKKFKKEVKEEIGLLKRLRKYSQWEMSGSKVPPLEFYTSRFDKLKQEFVPLTQEETQKLRQDLLKNRAPIKKKARDPLPYEKKLF